MLFASEFAVVFEKKKKTNSACIVEQFVLVTGMPLWSLAVAGIPESSKS